MKSFLPVVLSLILPLAPSVLAQNSATKGDPFQDPFANPVDESALPRVLIIGDSISIGYTPRVRKRLDGVANVHRPNTNCRWSAFGAEEIEEWIGDSEWDVIHFNFGLWDWYGWKQDEKASPESYAGNLDTIVTKLRAKTDATLIFAITTPPCAGPEKNAKIVVTDERAREFNRAARAVMEKHEVGINNLYDVVRRERERYQLGADDVHYNDAGRDLLASKVAARIKRELGKAPAKVINRPSNQSKPSPKSVMKTRQVARPSAPARPGSSREEFARS
jgi:acyl-CoA thioesterase-1